MSRLFIDPSVRSMGLALWSDKDWDSKRLRPTMTTLLTEDGVDFVDRAQAQADGLVNWLHDEGPSERVRFAYCEQPSFFMTNRGMAAAESGSLLKLMYHVGVLAGTLYERQVLFKLVPIQEWKGQLPKEVVIRRIKKILGAASCKNFTADVWDAVGIGLWKQGVL